MVVGLWLVASATSLVALWWSIRISPRRFTPAIIASAFALLLGYIGATRIHVAYSVTSDNSHWGVDSRWFFIVPLVVGLLSVVLALVNRKRIRALTGGDVSSAA